jgi:uncharacterized protein YndB with AHSA1/START domain
MEPIQREKIMIETTLHEPIVKIWEYWTEPRHIVQWNNASSDWHTTTCQNDLTVGGRFLSRMEAKDGSFGFDFSGAYDDIKPNELISYTLDDERKVEIRFFQQANSIHIVEIFEAENENSFEQQRSGWQSILDNFKAYTQQH